MPIGLRIRTIEGKREEEMNRNSENKRTRCLNIWTVDGNREEEMNKKSNKKLTRYV